MKNIALREAEMTNRKANRVLETLAAVLVFFLVWVVATESHGGAATGPARALPARILLSTRIGKDRRPAWWLERSRDVVELLDVHAVASRRRQGFTAEDREVPGTS